MDIAEIIRKEITRSKKSRYRIANDTGITEIQLSRLMKGRTLTAETLAVLLDYFGYEVRKKK
jgi:transcriptional regulator with XRE-family HTH domain